MEVTPEQPIPKIKLRSQTKREHYNLYQKIKNILTRQWVREKGELPAKIKAQIEELARDTSLIGVEKIDGETMANLGSSLIETVCKWRSKETENSDEWADSPVQIISHHIENPRAVDDMYEEAIKETLEDENDQDQLPIDPISEMPDNEADPEKADHETPQTNNDTIENLMHQLRNMTDAHRELQRDYKLLSDGQQSILQDLDQTLNDKEELESQLATTRAELKNYQHFKRISTQLDAEIQQLNRALQESRLEKSNTESERIQKRLQEMRRNPPSRVPISPASTTFRGIWEQNHLGTKTSGNEDI